MHLQIAIAILALPCFACAGLDTLRISAFNKPATYDIAERLGFFARHNLNVTYLQIASSVTGYNDFLNGNADLLLGAIDNTLGKRWNSGQPFVLLGEQVLASEFVLMSVPNITNVAQLKGRPLMVDSATSGYAYALQKMLSFYGLDMNSGDYSFQVVGGGNTRYEYLRAGSLPDGTAVYGTIVTYPFPAEVEAESASPLTPNVLVRASDLFPYAQNGYTATDAILANSTQRALITRGMTALIEANQYLANPTNRECSTNVLKKALNISQAAAETTYAAVTDSINGETALSQGGNFTFNVQALYTNIDLRGQYDGWNANVSEGFNFANALIPGPGQIIDYSIRDAAVQAGLNTTAPFCCH